MHSACDDRKTVRFSTFGSGAVSSGSAVPPDRCEMCGGDGPVLECEMTGAGLSYRLYVCTGCGRELLNEVASVAPSAKAVGDC